MGGGGASGMHGKGLAQGWRRAHLKHAVHVRDAGRVEGQRLVKRPRVLPSRKEGMYDAGRGVGREGAGCRAAAAAQAVCTGRARLLKAVGSIGTRGADPKHLVHAPDLGHVEAQWLVESHRVLPSQKEGIRCGVKCGPGEKAWGGGGASGMHGEGPTQGWGPQGTRRAHVEHADHVCDAGRVEAQRLVEGIRALPSRKAGMRCGKRCEPGGGSA